jgi:DNA-binding XRE family transcriptional regulator
MILTRIAAGELQKDLAAEYGVTPSCISHLARGTSWPHLGGVPSGRPKKRGSQRRCSKLTEEDIPIILRRVERGESLAAVARAYGVGRTTIADIWHGRRWTHVERPQRRRRAVYEDIYG